MTELLHNPHAVLILEQEQNVAPTIKVRAPVRNDRLRETIIDRASEPELFDELLMQQIADKVGQKYQPPQSLQSRLMELGLLVREEQISHTITFNCDLTRDIHNYLPQRPGYTVSPTAGTDLIVNPSLQFLGTSKSVAENTILQNCASSLQRDRFWYLVSQPELFAPRIYSFDTTQQEQLALMRPGESAPANLDADWVELLVAADILSTRDAFEKATAQAEKKIATAHDELLNNRYTVIKHSLHPYQLAAIRRYYRALIEQGHLRFGDAEWPLRFFAVNNPIARFYHDQLQVMIRKIVDKDIYTTFNYLASYRPGATLPAHRDREDCEYAISLLLDFIPEPPDLSTWPIFVEPPGRPDEPLPIMLGIGDLLLYFGCELVHYRYPFQEGKVSTTWLFFYRSVANDQK